MIRFAALLWCALFFAGGVVAQTGQDIRYVVIHTPGPLWQPGLDPREQPGMMDHVLHYKKLYEQGKLEMGGPFLSKDTGGMMVPVAGTTQEEIRDFAAQDPAVKTGLLKFEIRPWYVAMKRTSQHPLH